MSNVDAPVYIVSGYMRTGTSMMMQALEAGGLEVVARESRDEMRKLYADEHYDPNKGGLYELEYDDYFSNDFPKKFQGKLIKCLGGGLLSMHQMPRIKIVFMRRPFEEIRQSYQAFFGVRFDAKESRFERMTARVLQTLRARTDTDIEVFWYKDVLERPIEHFERLVACGWPIDPVLAGATVNYEMYRFRLENLEIGIP